MSIKKTTVGILTSIIVVSAGTASVFAAGQANGICDHCKSGQEKAQADGKGMRQGKGCRARQNK